MSKAIIGIASTLTQAETIVDRLKLSGFFSDQVSILMPDVTTNTEFGHENESKAPEGTAVGAGTGFLVGGVLGWLAGIGSLAIPGVGALIAAGPIMAALSGAAAGTALGGVTGGLIGLGIPEYEAKLYEGRLKEGHILIAAHTEDPELRKRAEEIMKECKAEDVHTVEAAKAK